MARTQPCGVEICYKPWCMTMWRAIQPYCTYADSVCADNVSFVAIDLPSIAIFPEAPTDQAIVADSSMITHKKTRVFYYCRLRERTKAKPRVDQCLMRKPLFAYSDLTMDIIIYMHTTVICNTDNNADTYMYVYLTELHVNCVHVCIGTYNLIIT